MMGHTMNTMILGLTFVASAYAITRSVGGPLMIGMVYGAAVFATMWWVVVPAIDPTMQEVNGVLFFIGHLMYGGAVGLAAAVGVERVSALRRHSVAA